MKSRETVTCRNFPCVDITSKNFLIPGVEISPEKIRMVMISESAPLDRKDYFYAGSNALFAHTTLLAFSDAGVKAGSIQELVNMGIYFTTAVKCSKTQYSIQTTTIQECSRLLEKEISQFPSIKVSMLMGDVAIKSREHDSQA